MGIPAHKLPAGGAAWLGAALALSVCGGVCLAGPGEKVEFSDTGASSPSTNFISSKLGTGLSHLSTSPGALRQIQDDVFNPLASPLDPLDSMQGVFTTQPNANQQPQSAAEIRRIRRQNDKRKNWAFANANVLDGTGGTDPEAGMDLDSLSLDGKDKEQSVIEMFVNGKGANAATNQSQSIEWYSAAREGREDSFGNHAGGDPNNPHATTWGKIMNRDFFADDQGADHPAEGGDGFRPDNSAARAAADFTTMTRQRDAFRDLLNAPAGGMGASSSDAFSSRSSAAALFSAPAPASAPGYSATHSSLFGSSETFGSAYGVHTVAPANPAPSGGLYGPMGNAVNSPAAVQQLLDPSSAVMKKPTW